MNAWKVTAWVNGQVHCKVGGNDPVDPDLPEEMACGLKNGFIGKSDLWTPSESWQEILALYERNRGKGVFCPDCVVAIQLKELVV